MNQNVSVRLPEEIIAELQQLAASETIRSRTPTSLNTLVRRAVYAKFPHLASLAGEDDPEGVYETRGRDSWR